MDGTHVPPSELTYTFNFGDGTPSVSGTGASGANVTHAYTNDGVYNITVTITDGYSNITLTYPVITNTIVFISHSNHRSK